MNPPVRFGRPVPWPLGHGHVSLSGRRGSRTLKARRSSVFRPGAVASRLALPFAVWMAGFEPAWSGFRRRRMMPGSPTSRKTFAPSQRPTKKARGRVTPGLESRRPEGSGVTVAEGTRCAQRPDGRQGPRDSPARTRYSCDCLPSCPLPRQAGSELRSGGSTPPPRTSSRPAAAGGGSPIRSNSSANVPGAVPASRPGGVVNTDRRRCGPRLAQACYPAEQRAGILFSVLPAAPSLT